MTSRKRNWLIGLISILVLLSVLVYFFEWNMLRGPLERRISKATGRDFAINGDLKVKLSWTPLIELHEVTLSNAPWSDNPRMLEVQQVQITIALPSLFRNEISLPSVRLVKPMVNLEVNDQGMNNWSFLSNDSSSKQSGKSIDTGHVVITDGQLMYRNAIDHSNLTIRMSSETSHAQGTELLSVSASGAYQGLDTQAQGEVGAINNIKDLQRTYPVHLEGHIGKTALVANGTANKPLQLQGLDVEFKLSGGSMAELFPLIGVPLPATPPYSLSGKILRSGALWHLPTFSGKVGNSDLQGQFSLDRSRLPQFINATLQSNNLDMKDLSGFIGAREDSGEKVESADRVLPNSPFSFEKLHAANASVKFTGKHIVTKRLPLDDMQVSMVLRDGHLSLEPLNFGVAGGDVRAIVSLDSNTNPISTATDIKIRNLKLDELLPNFQSEKINIGMIGGRAKFAGHGDSFAAILGSANGQIAFMMNGGSISKLLVRLSNLDVANSVIALLGNNKSVPIRCMVTDLHADDGLLSVRTMVLDTDKAAITGEGHINLKDESLDLRLKSDPKDLSLIALRGPIDLKGTLKHPSPAPALKNVSGRVVLAAALGAISGGLAFIPLLEFGGGEDSDCAKLLRDAAVNSQKTPSPSASIKPMMLAIKSRDEFMSISF